MSTGRDDRFEHLVNRLHSEMDIRIDRIGLNLRSESVPGAKKTPEDQQLQQFLAMRDSPEAWSALIQQKGVKSAVKYSKFGERLLDRTVRRGLSKMGLDESALPPARKSNPALIQALVQATSQMEQAMQQPPVPMVPEEGDQPMM